MFRNSKVAIGAIALGVLAAACGSSSHGGTANGGTTASSTGAGTGGAGGGKTLTIGVLTDMTGEAASGNKTTPLGAQAGAVVAGKDGFKFKFVDADSQTSPSSVLSAAQKLVQVDHVDAVIMVSAVGFGAAPYLKQQGIPVVGLAEDSTEWITDSNMFSTFGFLDPSQADTTFGTFMKLEGGTTIGSLGYSISPSSADSAKGIAASAKAAGLKVGYLNANFPFGSTNVAPEAIAMKNAGVDTYYGSVDPNTSFAMIQALRQNGVNLKIASLPTGYGGDLQQAGPGAIQTGQGVYFSLSFEPIEMNTPATRQFAAALKQIGVNGDPTYAEYGGYTAMAAIDAALKTAGTNATHAQLISALNGITNFNAWGLLGTHSFNMSDRAGTATGVDGCLYMTKLEGGKFKTVAHADPVCGTPLPA
ncbi:MAG: ABC transporter substrate-binding protein [Actinomycetota bacterium]|nr:ABC transporter substrate-binding protein [Actinomycetota bacterium]